MSAPCNHEFFEAIEIYGKNFRSIGQPEVPDQDPPVLTTPLYNTQNKSYLKHAKMGVQTSATVWKVTVSLVQVSAKLCFVSRSKKPI